MARARLIQEKEAEGGGKTERMKPGRATETFRLTETGLMCIYSAEERINKTIKH